jgi:hypothetical protein
MLKRCGEQWPELNLGEDDAACRIETWLGLRHSVYDQLQVGLTLPKSCTLIINNISYQSLLSYQVSPFVDCFLSKISVIYQEEFFKKLGKYALSPFARFLSQMELPFLEWAYNWKRLTLI